ncbi:DUF1624 domain-containing protein [Aquimarina spongiae]|uniref:Uncharacterized membrane protein n=1 Tax=Aquimarina spongiae TaxID=570521 RepID=A0A1M6FL98_9FLAO|nr:heparan-alpha-glucosaminide N-acetyltransferase domain-containing protein [Aquimarina spongiae]SHI98436.1 Uncharacterized membrane protein [Aquimarina spongiae]
MLKSKRIESIDILRGIVMIIMCLDHTRDFFQDLQVAGSPMNLKTTTPTLFFTRYITHFCAPVFVFLSGLSVYLQSMKKTKNELTKFLITRGIWLIFLEVVLNNFLWGFDIRYFFISFQVIWAIGVSMIVLAGIIHLKKHIVLALGIAIVVGHNLIDVFIVDKKMFEYSEHITWDFFWYLFYQRGVMQINEYHYVRSSYPMLPWLGIMILGYCLGRLYAKTIGSKARFKYLLSAGSLMLLLFALLRTFNLYGDPQWSFDVQGSFFESLVSFLRITKYPPSFHFTLITLGVCLIALALLEKVKNQVTNFLLVFGRVPLFFYFLHVAVIHLSSMLLKPFYGDTMYSAINNYENYINREHRYLGTDLLGVYIAWILIIAVLYYPCLKYMYYKMNNKEKKWLSYL